MTKPRTGIPLSRSFRVNQLPVAPMLPPAARSLGLFGSINDPPEGTECVADDAPDMFPCQRVCFRLADHEMRKAPQAGTMAGRILRAKSQPICRSNSRPST